MLLSDYLKNETISALQTYKILYAEAIKAGYKLTDDEQKSIDDQVEELRNTAAENKYSLNAYLKASYGKGINEKYRFEIPERHLKEAHRFLQRRRHKGCLRQGSQRI